MQTFAKVLSCLDVTLLLPCKIFQGSMVSCRPFIYWCKGHDSDLQHPFARQGRQEVESQKFSLVLDKRLPHNETSTSQFQNILVISRSKVVNTVPADRTVNIY